MRRRLASTLFASFAISMVMTTWWVESGGASPATIADVAWWSRNPLAQAPNGGFQVATAPDGTLSVAAFHVQTTGVLQRATVTLTEAGGSTANAAGATLLVCPTYDPFTASSSHTYTSAPKPACDRAKASLTRNANATWTADITSVVAAASSPPALMVVPDSTAAPTLFQIEFAAPAVDLTVLGSTTSTPFGSGATGTTPPSGSASAVTPSRPSTVVAPARPASPAVAAAPAAPAANDAAGVQAAVQPRSVLPTSDTSPTDGANPWLKGLTLVLIAAAVGIAAGVGRRYVAPRFS